MKKALVIGGGMAGCAAAHQLLLLGDWDVTIIECAPFLGAGNRTMRLGGHPYTFGPRHFLTQNEKVWSYFDALVPMRKFGGDHQFWTYVESDSQFYSYPIHADDIHRMPEAPQIGNELEARGSIETANNLEEYWIRSVGETLYAKFVDGYSRKMWRIDDNKQIDDFAWSPKGVALKSGKRAAWDKALSGYPVNANGYDPYFSIATEGAKVVFTRAKFDLEHKRAKWGEGWHKFDIIVSTASPDDVFDRAYGSLPYVGRDFHPFVLPIENAFPANVAFLYYAGPEKFTLLVEYKKFTQHQSPHTLIGMEIPSGNGRHYPMPMKRCQKLAADYHSLMPEGVFAMGRLGSYRYAVDIAASIEQAFDLTEHIKSGAGSGVLGKWRN